MGSVPSDSVARELSKGEFALTGKTPRWAWGGWVFLAWTAIVLIVYVRQLLANAALLGVRLVP